MQRFKSTAWLLPYLAVVIAEGVARPLQRWQGVGLAAFVACLLGWTAGVTWFAIYPRPLAQRLNGLAGLWAVFVVVIGLIALVHLLGGDFGRVTSNSSDRYGVVAAVSVLAGLVLSEINASPAYHSRWRRWTRSPKSVPIEADGRELRHSDLSDKP